MDTERRVIYEPVTDENGKETGELRKEIVRIRKFGKYEIIVNTWLLQEIFYFLGELKNVNERDTYKKLMYEFGAAESIAKAAVKKYLDGTLLDIVGQYDYWEGGMRTL